MGRAERKAVYTLLCLWIGVTLVAGFAAAAEPDTAAGPPGHWEKLPPPPGRSMYVSQIALEPRDTLWVMAGTGVHYWAGDGFRPPAGDELRAGQYLTGLYGGCDRPLFASQRGTEENRGKIYRLSDGRALYETDFYYGASHNYPGLYVSKSGLLFNSTPDGLALYTDGEWKQTGTAVRLRNSLVFDTGKRVHFYFEGRLHSIDPDGRVLWETRLPEGPYDAHSGRSYDAYWPVIDRHDDLVLVVDRNMVLHLLDCDDGRYRASIALTAAFRQDPDRVGRVELVTMPSIEGENLITVTDRGVVAYRIAEFLERP